MIEPAVGWPLSHERRELLVFLGELIGLGGAERFTSAPVVRADERDFPGPWEPTRFAVHALLYRLFWHAHLDVEIEVEDHRPRAAPRNELLETSVIELVAAADGRAVFQIEAIGNDDVSGLLAHEVGAAFVELLPPDPFRGAKRQVTPAGGELPTCPGCGGTIAETIAHANLRLERLEELQRDAAPDAERE